MDISAIVEFWRKLEGNIHPDDALALSHRPSVFNLDYPPPAYIGDVLRAPVIVLMANGGYADSETDGEFAFESAAQGYRERLRDPRPSDARYTAPYYQRGELWKGLRSGGVCVVNAVAYRSKVKDRAVEDMADRLPSTRLHRRWLIEAIAPLAATRKRAVIVHRPGLWKLRRGQYGEAGLFYARNPQSRYLDSEVWYYADQWLSNSGSV